MSSSPRIVALVPACNEEDQIGHTIESLLEQTHKLEKIVVIANNCVDGTAEIARTYADIHPSITVMEIHHNRGKKAGALNCALATLDPDQWDFVLQMDADTLLDRHLVMEGILEFQRNPQLGGVCSRCFLKPHGDETPLVGRILWRFQNLEYGFGDSARIQRSGRVNVLAGAVCIYRMDVLLKVAHCRIQRKSSSIVWREDSLVEDYELTLDTQKLGYDTEVGMRMFSLTDAMLTIPELKAQRLRWYGGTAATLRRRKLASEIRKEVAVQSFYMIVILGRLALVLLWMLVLIAVPVTQLGVEWWWLIMPLITTANYLSRIRYVRDRDVSQWIIVSTLLPLELYITWDQILTVVSYGKNFIKPSTSW